MVRKQPFSQFFGALVVLSCFAGSVVADETQFDFSGGDLGATFGPGTLGYYNGVTTSDVVSFGTASSLGLPALPGGDAAVLSFPAFTPEQGLLLDTAAGANGGGQYINQYTMIWDLLVPDVGANWFSFYNTNATNSNDGEFFINTSGGIGISGQYDGTVNSGQWHRIAISVDLTTSTMDKYIDGALVFSQTIGGLDGRWSMYTTGEPETFLLTDNNGETNAGYLSSYYFTDEALDSATIGAFGPPDADGPAGAPATLTWDGQGPGPWSSTTRWLGGPPNTPDSLTHVVVPTDTVTVDIPGDARSLSVVNGGGILIADDGSLSVVKDVEVTEGASLRIGSNAVLAARGGSVSALLTAGNATVDVGGEMSVDAFSDAVGGMLRKQGEGTLAMANLSVTETTIAADAGTVELAGGTNLLAGVPKFILGGGAVTLRGISTAENPPQGAVSVWDFNDGPGSAAAADSAGTNHGTLMNMDPATDWVTGHSGTPGDYALEFDGESGASEDPTQHVSVGVAPSLQLTDQVSIAAWVKAQRFGEWDGIAGWIHDTGGEESGYSLTTMSGGGLAFAVETDAASNLPYQTAYGHQADTWYHVVGTYDGSHQRIYIDGILAEEWEVTGPIDWEPLSPDGFEIGRYHDDNENLVFQGSIDDVRVYDRALSAAEITAWHGLQAPDVSAVEVSVTAQSALNLEHPATFSFAALSLKNDILTIAGSAEGVSFTGTAIDAAAGAVVGVDVALETELNQIDIVNPTPVTFSKRGPADLVLTSANRGTGWGSHVTVDAGGGRLIVVHASNPVADASLQIGGGELVLASAAAAPGHVTYDNAVSAEADGTLTAGSGGVAGATPGPLTVTVGSKAGNGIQVAADTTLTLRSTDQYTLNVAGGLFGAGQLSVQDAGSMVTLSGGGSPGSLKVGDGTVNVSADLEVQTLTVTGGVVDTGSNQVVVSDRMILGTTPFTIDAAHTFSVSGKDLVNGDADRLVTLRGGRLGVGVSSVPVDGLVSYWAMNDGPESPTAADSAGGNDGTLVNMNPGTVWVPGHTGAPGDYALQFEGFPEEYLSVGADPSLQVTDAISISAWVNVAEFNDWAVIAGWIHDTGSTESGYALLTRSGEGFGFGLKTEAGGFAYPTMYGYQTSRWYHLVATYDGSFQRLYVDGGEVQDPPWPVSATGPIDWDPPGDEDGFEIGRYHDDNEEYPFWGVIDDVVVYERALTAEEVDSLYRFVPGEGLNLRHTNLVVTADSTLAPEAVGGAVFGNLTLGAGIRLDIAGTEAAFRDVSAGHEATIAGTIAVQGNLSPGGSPGRLNIVGNLELDEGAVYQVEVAEWDSENVPNPWNPIPPTGPINDKIDVNSGDALLGGTLEVLPLGKLSPPHPAPGNPQVMLQWYGYQTRMIASAAGENSVAFQFDAVPEALPEVPDIGANWGQGHLGNGVFLTRQTNTMGDADPQDRLLDQPGVSYFPNATLVHLFQAADGDTNGDGTLDGLDLQAILAAQTFGTGRKADWTTGDFTDGVNGDSAGVTDGEDLQAILATGLWGTPQPYAAVDPGDPGDGVVDLILDPGPGSLSLSTDGVVINGYVIKSRDGIFTGEPAQNLGAFQIDNDQEISGNFFFTLDGEHFFGKVIGPEWEIFTKAKGGGVNPFEDLTFTYTRVDMPGAFFGNLIVIPEPGTVVMLGMGLLALAAYAWRMSRRRGAA